MYKLNARYEFWNSKGQKKSGRNRKGNRKGTLGGVEYTIYKLRFDYQIVKEQLLILTLTLDLLASGLPRADMSSGNKIINNILKTTSIFMLSLYCYFKHR